VCKRASFNHDRKPIEKKKVVLGFLQDASNDSWRTRRWLWKAGGSNDGQRQRLEGLRRERQSPARSEIASYLERLHK
jgi:hypothetical protein